MPRADNKSAFCGTHARVMAQRAGRAVTEDDQRLRNAEAVSKELVSLSGEFKTASDVNHALGKLFSLYAQRHIDRRDAIAFAYIGQLILQSLPHVQREIKTGLGYDAWEETLQAVLDPGHDTDEDDSDDSGAEDEDEDDRSDADDTGEDSDSDDQD